MGAVPTEPSDLWVFDRPEDVDRSGSFRFDHLPFALLPAGARDEIPGARVLRRYALDRSRLLAGLDFFLGCDGDVVNLSLGPAGRFDPADPLQLATRALAEAGRIVVVAAGNSGPDEDSLQAVARAPWVIAVGAVGDDGAPLDSSSRGIPGRPDVPAPAFASFGTDPMDPPLTPGTSFAAPRVARAALYARKCVELLVATLGTTDDGAVFLPPVRLPWLAIADTGWDPERAPYRWGPIASTLLPANSQVQLTADGDEQRWCRAVRELAGWRVEEPDVCAATVRALHLAAEPLAADRSIVGAGLVTHDHVQAFFRALTPSRAAAVLGADTDLVDAARALDGTLGPIWRDDRMAVVEDVLGTGVRFTVARVIG